MMTILITLRQRTDMVINGYNISRYLRQCLTRASRCGKFVGSLFVRVIFLRRLKKIFSTLIAGADRNE